MKSFLNLIMIVTALFFLTGCGEKEQSADNTLSINPQPPALAEIREGLGNSETNTFPIKYLAKANDTDNPNNYLRLKQ